MDSSNRTDLNIVKLLIKEDYCDIYKVHDENTDEYVVFKISIN